jgi:hypothetical protein
MAFGYPSLYGNGLNSNTQIRRAVDMGYQRGATYEVVLTGDTYQSSMELVVDLYVDNTKEGRMSVVPYSIESLSSISEQWEYRFNIRPYEYLQNYLDAEHYKRYERMNWSQTNTTINEQPPYPNSINFNVKYGYRYVSGTTVVTEYTTDPVNEFDHFTDIPNCPGTTGYTPSDFTNTGGDYTLVGGNFQMYEKFYYPNEDQEIGSVIGTGMTVNTLDTNRRLSPMSQFLMDYPSVPEKSETSRFLTEAPRIQRVDMDDHYALYYLYGQTGDRQVIEADFAVFNFYEACDSGASRIFRYEVDLREGEVQPTGYTTDLQIRKLPCGPRDIDTIFIDDFFGGGSSGGDSVGYYDVQLFSAYDYSFGSRRADLGPIVPISEKFYFYPTFTSAALVKGCSPESTRLSFLNSRGGYDYFTFKSYREEKKKISRETYESRYYAPNYQSPDHDFGRSTKQFAQDVDREVILESDFLTVEQGNWLEDLFLSPQVYEMKPSFISPMGCQDEYYMDLRPVQILSTEVETITKKHKKLNKYRITLKYADSWFSNKGF